MVLSQVEIEQHHVHWRARQDLERFGGRAAARGHLEIRFGSQQAAQAFTEQNVVIE